MGDYERLKNNITTLDIHNKTHKPVRHITNGKKYEVQLIDELVEDVNVVLSDINRQKAEIERLKKENKILSSNADTAFQDGLNEAQELYAEQIKSEIEAEAVKEFAKLCVDKSENGIIYVSDLLDYVKEIVGNNNAE